MQQIEKYEIPEIDLVIVDLYPFEATVASGASEADIIEKIDIGGISLIRAAAKNYNDVIIVASQAQYKPLLDMLMEHGATSSLEERRWMAKEAFAVSSHYDSAIFNYFDAGEGSAFRCSVNSQKQLRYGENPHQKGYFYGNLEAMFDQIHGKEISYNNPYNSIAVHHSHFGANAGRRAFIERDIIINEIQTVLYHMSLEQLIIRLRYLPDAVDGHRIELTLF